MPTDLENLQTIKTNYIAVLLADSTDPKPTYDWEGRMVKRSEWRQLLMEAIREINALIGEESSLSPFEVDEAMDP